MSGHKLVIAHGNCDHGIPLIDDCPRCEIACGLREDEAKNAGYKLGFWVGFHVGAIAAFLFILIVSMFIGCDVLPQQTEPRTTPYSTYHISTGALTRDSLVVLPLSGGYMQPGKVHTHPNAWSVYRYHVEPGDYQLWWTPHGDTLAVMINKPRVKEKGVLTFLIYKLEPGDKTRMVRL